MNVLPFVVYVQVAGEPMPNVMELPHVVLQAVALVEGL
jgi:hypothetical protein